ncbi:hypothetical protein [Spiroplasma poulsonii]|uniref:Uncharacterized protein n=1 Tax=Spiroplasma poulsonii TaxID=2138 RepID=A0A2P6F8L9_9MOLU|nr:hypothetical protein [Spiroplasma poulsonii]PQM29803.1 hypothetical protein SMSRO_SF029710 [Spiroplasma poulsonii]
MALTKEQLIEQGLSEEIAENILNQFIMKPNKLEKVCKNAKMLYQRDFIKLSNELDELKPLNMFHY